MAEAVGLTASILAIAGAATRLSVGLYEIASVLKDAGREIRTIAFEISSFSRVLKEISAVLQNINKVIWRAKYIAEDLVQICQSVQLDGENLLRILEPLVQKNANRSQHIALRLRWLFQRSKFIYYRETMTSLKLNLQLLLSIIQITRESDEDAYISLKHNVQNLRSDVESSIRVMQINLQSRTVTASLMHTLEEHATPIGPRGNNEEDSLPIPEISEHGLGRPLERSALEADTSMNETQSSLALVERQQDEQENPEEIEYVDLISYFRLLFVQEKLSNLAEVVLELPKTKTEPSRESISNQTDPDEVLTDQVYSTRRVTSVHEASSRSMGQSDQMTENAVPKNRPTATLEEPRERSFPYARAESETSIATSTEPWLEERRNSGEPSVAGIRSNENRPTLGSRMDSEAQEPYRQKTRTPVSSRNVQEMEEEIGLSKISRQMSLRETSLGIDSWNIVTIHPGALVSSISSIQGDSITALGRVSAYVTMLIAFDVHANARELHFSCASSQVQLALNLAFNHLFLTHSSPTFAPPHLVNTSFFVPLL
ncbi:MAG: hypothetical protein M1820_007444 [Bogoriella megaspora]|nr:MAG: hypothetical protein M1820_007444 [Bogoriella megaspora]